MKKELAWLTQRPIAHRGLHDGKRIPENSLAAFEKAIALDYPIECDARMTADGEVVVFHDANLKRLTGDVRMLTDVPYPELNDLHILQTQEKIPTLRDVLKLIDGRVPVLIEIKNKGRVGQLEKKVQELLGNYHGIFALQSFNPLSVLWFLRHSPSVATGQIIQCSPSTHIRISIKRWMLRLKWYTQRQYPDFISYEEKCFPHHYFSSLHKKKKMPMLTWTIDSQEKFEKVKKMSDNIIFENIDPLA